MNQFPNQIQEQRSSSVSNTQNRVLRNTYWLLASSMVPTVLGAMLAMHYQFFMHMRPGIFTLLFFVGAFGLMYLVERNRHSSTGVFMLYLFTFFMGAMLSPILSVILQLRDGPQIIMMAFGGTGIIFATMATIASTAKKDFSTWSKTLFLGVVVIILAGIANIFFQVPALSLTISVLAMVIFSAFILVDVQRVVRGGETNYISATLTLYLDIYNVFVSLLNIIGLSSRN
ncbi:Bax inhibitor-1/YccA family protein [Brackiella oedipodis]|uniref:Bax inhibitor-1/YccA family protein n=1 Tax=Brackiella oedipodis TaxID=124225 RepID=UPI00049081FC|nr:Bax inhibitor-1/YccA family protein [Brackiella oedipodis]